MVALDRLPTPAEMMRHLDRRVVGQTRAKRELAAAIYRHYLDLVAGASDPALRGGRHHTLLLGPTGCGKSLLVRVLADFLGVPVAICSATSLSEVGYTGDSVDSLFVSLLAAANGDVARAERGIIFLDEVDKLRRAPDIGRDVSGEGVQNALLAVLDGLPVRWRRGERAYSLDSSRVLFVFAGAFAGLPAMMRERQKRRQRTSLGFGASHGPVRRELADAEAYRTVSPEDLVHYGMIPELVGRFATISVVEPLELPDLVRILRDVEGAPLERERRHFERHGLRLELAEDASEALARRARETGTGARGLARLLGQVLAPVSWRLPDLAEAGVAGVRVQRAAVEEGAEPEMLTPAEVGEWTRPPLGHEVLRRVAFGGALPVTEERRAAPERPADREEAARIVEQLRPKVGYQHLRPSQLLHWHQYAHERSPQDLAYLFGQLDEHETPLSAFVDALRERSGDEMQALIYYAGYLHRRHPPKGGKPDAGGQGRLGL